MFCLKTAPHCTLLKNTFVWEANEQQAFDDIKTIIFAVPELCYLKETEPLQLQVDASSSGLEACLIQGDHPICYANIRPFYYTLGIVICCHYTMLFDANGCTSTLENVD